MGLFDRFFKSKAPTPPPEPPVEPVPKLPPVPGQLPRIAAGTAAEICQQWKLQPAAEQLLTPRQTPAQFLSVLQEKEMGDEFVKFLAYGLPDLEGVAWAIRSVEKLPQDKMAPADVQALRAAQAWVKNPTEASKAAAAAATAKTDYQSPAAWAAQAAAWAQIPAPDRNSVGGAQRLTPHAVAGCVLLAATIAPAGEKGTFRAQYPFIALGLEIASGTSAPA